MTHKNKRIFFKHFIAFLGVGLFSQFATPVIAENIKINVGALRFTSHAAVSYTHLTLPTTPYV